MGRSAAFILALAMAAALGTVACSGGGNKTTVSTVGGRTPAHTGPVTGIPELDQIINSALDGDTIQLAALTGYQKVPCTKNPAPGGGAPPQCRDAESDGTQVEVLPYKVCEQEWVRPEQVPDTYQLALKGTPAFDTAYVPKPAFDFGAQYVVVLKTGTRDDGSPSGVAFHVKDGRIAVLQNPCDLYTALVSPDLVQSYVATPIADGATPGSGATQVPATP